MLQPRTVSWVYWQQELADSLPPGFPPEAVTSSFCRPIALSSQSSQIYSEEDVEQLFFIARFIWSCQLFMDLEWIHKTLPLKS